MLNFQFGLQRALPPHECKIAVETFTETQDAYCIMSHPDASAPPARSSAAPASDASPACGARAARRSWPPLTRPFALLGCST